MDAQVAGPVPAAAEPSEWGRAAGWIRRRGADADRATMAVLCGAALIGLALRWYVLAGPLGYVDYDEAAVGIQASRFFEDPAVFFPGQAYGGTIEIFLTSSAFELTSNALVLKLVPIALHATAAMISWRAARRIVPTVAGQLAVPVLLWVGPAFGVWESTKARGFYGAAIVLAAAALLLAARAVDEPTFERFGAFGVVAGVAAWTTPLLVLVYVPCGAWLFARTWRRWRTALWVLPGALLGAGPVVVWNHQHGWESFASPSQQSATSWEIFTNGLAKLPALVGAATPWDPDRALLPTGATAPLLLAVLVVATLRTRRTAPGLLATSILGYAALYAWVVPLGAMGQDPRYLYPLLPALAVAVGAVLPQPTRRPGTAGTVGAVALAAAALSWWGIHGIVAAADEDPAFLSTPGIQDVTEFLRSREIDRATTDVAGTQITFASGGDIAASSFAVPRFADLQATMFIDEPSAYVLETRQRANLARLERTAEARGIGVERRRFGDWTVLLLDAWLPPWDAGMVVFGGQLTEEIARRPPIGSG